FLIVNHLLQTTAVPLEELAQSPSSLNCHNVVDRSFDPEDTSHRHKNERDNKIDSRNDEQSKLAHSLTKRQDLIMNGAGFGDDLIGVEDFVYPMFLDDFGTLGELYVIDTFDEGCYWQPGLDGNWYQVCPGIINEMEFLPVEMVV
ncbi:2085_t:CDS:1, partial [Acaulospora colombiana]